MLGIESTSIWLAYVLSIISTIGCVVYGIFTWNKGEEGITPDDRQWLQEEKELEKEL